MREVDELVGGRAIGRSSKTKMVSKVAGKKTKPKGAQEKKQ
jgi:hypothetical protein